MLSGKFFNVRKFGMGFFGGLILVQRCFWVLILPPLDHPRHLKSGVQSGDEYQIYTGDKYTNAWPLGTLKPSFFFYFLFNDLLQHRKINILLKQEKNTKTKRKKYRFV